jgi:hypothetical protein
MNASFNLMNTGRIIAIGFIICIGLISWGANAFQQKQILRKSDPRVHDVQLKLAQLSRLKSVPDLELSLTQLDQLIEKLMSTSGYELAFELVHVHRIKAIWLMAQSKMAQSETVPSEIDSKPRANELSERAAQEVELGLLALESWRSHWEGLTANEILERLKTDFMKDPALAENSQLMIMVGGRADKIIQAMKDFDLLKSALEELGSLK